MNEKTPVANRVITAERIARLESDLAVLRQMADDEHHAWAELADSVSRLASRINEMENGIRWQLAHVQTTDICTRCGYSDMVGRTHPVTRKHICLACAEEIANQ